MGSLADLMKEDRLLRAAKIRAPYGRQVGAGWLVDAMAGWLGDGVGVGGWGLMILETDFHHDWMTRF
jgi:hypothetical protein